MTDPQNEPDRRLSELLSDAVSDVEPTHALGSIRSRTKEHTMRSRRPWLFGVGGAVLATAAVITAVTLVGGTLTGSDEEPDRTAASPTATSAPDTSAPGDPTGVPTSSVPVYYVADTPQGPRLFREFQQSADSDVPTAAPRLAVAGTPLDPDYRSAWPDGVTVSEVTYESGLATVDLDPGTAGDLRARPSGMSADEASLAIEQVIYSVQAGLQEGRVPVQLLVSGQRSDQILGVPTSEPLANAPELDVLALVNITSPTEGETVSGSFVADGVASSFEATVPWEIRKGDRVVLDGFSTAEGWMDKLYPFRTDPIDVSGLAPGDYTFAAMTDDPSGGEGAGPTEDSRTITIE